MQSEDRAAKAAAWQEQHRAEIEARAATRRAEREAKAAAWRAGHQAEIEGREAAQQAARETRAAEWRAEHEHELAIERAARAMEQDDRRLPRAADLAAARQYDPFDLEMAARFVNADGSVGLSIEDFLAWREKQRRRMQSLPSIEEQMRNAPVRG